MHIIPCPFCGPRDETEFRFGAEAGKRRPTRAASAEEWSRYLYVQDNPKGDTREIWVHLACGEFFLLERNSLTHEIRTVQGLRKEDRP
jgi:sarcosine oxidase, subunit delta